MSFEVQDVNCGNCFKAKVFHINWYTCIEGTKNNKLDKLFKNPKYYHAKAKKCNDFKSMGKSKDWYNNDYEVHVKRELKSKGVDIEAIQ